MSTPPAAQEPAGEAVKEPVRKAIEILNKQAVLLVLADTADELERKRQAAGETLRRQEGAPPKRRIGLKGSAAA